MAKNKFKDIKRPDERLDTAQRQAYLKELKKSNYRIMANPNVSHARCQKNPDYKRKVQEGLTKVGDDLEFILEDKSYHMSGYGNANLIHYEYKPEIGSNTTSYHFEGICKFDGETRLNYTKLNEWFQDAISDFSRGGRISFSQYQNIDKAMEKYIDKQQQQDVTPDDDIVIDKPKKRKMKKLGPKPNIIIDESKPVNLKSMKRDELRKIAKTHGMKNITTHRKAEIIEWLLDKGIGSEL